MISVILTTYKRETGIVERALNSVLNQDFNDIEVIIVNDDPNNTEVDQFIVDYINAHGEEIPMKYVHVEKNGGACAARNIGVENSNGEYIAFIDDDDEWMSSKLRMQFEQIREADDCVLVTGYIQLPDGIIYNKGLEFEGDVLKELLAQNFVGGTSTPLIRKSAFLEVGCFDEKYPSSQDYNLWIRLAKVGKFSFVKDTIVKYFYSDDSITKNVDKRIAGWKCILEDFEQDYLYYRESYSKFVFLCCSQLKGTTLKNKMYGVKMLLSVLKRNGISVNWIGALYGLIL